MRVIDVEMSQGDGLARLPAAEALDSPPEDSLEAVRRLYDSAVALATSQIEWYRSKSRRKKRGSTYLRFGALFFGSIGTVLPIAANSLAGVAGATPASLLPWGYLAIALAATCLAWDRFWGFSSGWSRFVLTELTLQRALTAFRHRWCIETLKTIDDPRVAANARAKLVRDFADAVHARVEDETREWVREFQASLRHLQEQTEAGTERQALPDPATAPSGGTIHAVGENKPN